MDRRCNKCGKFKLLEEFEKAARYRGGRMPVCIECRAAYRAELHRRAKQDPGSSKRCCKCQSDLPLSEFSRDKRSPDGYTPRCKPCRVEGRADSDPRVAKDRFLRWKFGIGLGDYEALYAAQEGRCAVCGNGVTQARRRFLDIDHDHETGRVRGLLCSPCNTALGLLKEDPERMVRLAEYVRGFQ